MRPIHENKYQEIIDYTRKLLEHVHGNRAILMYGAKNKDGKIYVGFSFSKMEYSSLQELLFEMQGFLHININDEPI